jgi:hypothetical protein
MKIIDIRIGCILIGDRSIETSPSIQMTNRGERDIPTVIELFKMRYDYLKPKQYA